MIQVFEERRKPTVGQKLAGGLEKALPMVHQFHQEAEAKKLQSQGRNALGTYLESLGVENARQFPFETQQKLAEQFSKYQARKGILDQLGFGNESGDQQYNGQRKQSAAMNESQDMNPSDQMNDQGEFEIGPVSLDTVPKKVSQDRINAAAIVEPSLAREWREGNKAIDKEEARKQNIQIKEKQFFHRESTKYDETLNDQATSAEKKNRSLDRQLANVDKIGWWDRLISTGIAGPLTDILRSKTAQEFDANTLAQLEGQRQLLGGVLSDSDIRLLMQKIVTASKNPEANKYIGQFMKLENEIPILKKKIGDELKADNGGYRPANYRAEIDKIFDLRYGDEIRKMQEDILQLPDDNKTLGQIGRRMVPPGTPLGEDTALMYLKLAGNDPDVATKMAQKDGYDTSE